MTQTSATLGEGQHVATQETRTDARRGSQVEAVSNSESEDLCQIPGIRGCRGQHTIDGEGHDGTIVEKSDDKDHEGREVELVGEGEDGEADDDTDGDGAGVDGVVAHPLEDDTGLADGVDDGRETRLSQHNIGGTARGIGCTLDRNTDVGTGESRGVVGTVTSHGAEMTETLEALDDLVLVFGEDSSETIGVHDHLVEVGVLAAGGGTILQDTGRVHVVTHTKTTASLLSDSELVTSDHLDLDTESLSLVDGLLGVITGRIEDGEKTNKLESVALSLEVVTVDLLVGNSESTETTEGVLLNVGLETVLELFILVASAKVDDDGGHTLGNTLELAGGLLTVGDLGTLVNGVEGLEVEEGNSGTSAGGVPEGLDDGGVDGVLVLGTGGVGSEKDHILCREGAVGLDSVAINGELVGGEGTSLVGAKDGDTSQLLNGRNTGDDGLVLGELLGTDGEGDGQDSGHGNGDTTNEEDEDVVETTAVTVAEASVKDEDLGEDEDTNGDETERSDLGENLLQVAGRIVILSDEGGSTTEEGVGTSGDNHTLGLTVLASGATAELTISAKNGG